MFYRRLCREIFRSQYRKFSTHKFPAEVTIVEVGPRDGLQNEKTILPAEIKLQLIHRLRDCGLNIIEMTSFVSPKWVPQMGDCKEVSQQLRSVEGTKFVALVPNMKGLETAIACGVKHVAVFAAASETFSRKNINCSIEESLSRFFAFWIIFKFQLALFRYGEVVKNALKEGLTVRGYVSCVVGCPYEGKVNPRKVSRVAGFLSEVGCWQISLGDTIGVGK